MFYLYWSFIVLSVLVLVILTFKNSRVNFCMSVLVGQLMSNNNWWWGALGVFAVIFSISAILAGFGRPLLVSSAEQAKATLTEKVDQLPGMINELKQLWHGTNTPPVPAKVVTPTVEKKYSSWWHWVWAGFLWLSWVVYTPFAFSDEASTAIKKAIKAVERRRRLDNIRSRSVTTSIVTPTATAPSGTPTQPEGVITKGNLFKQLLKVEVLTEFLEVFFNLLIKRAGNLFK